MPTRLTSVLCFGSAAVLTGAALLGTVPASAQVARSAPSTACMSARQFYEDLDNRTQATTYRGGAYPWGVTGVRCAGRWAAAGVLAAGGQNTHQPAFEYTGFEVRSSSGRWHEASRTRPCATHAVPRSLYRYACESN